VTLRAKPRAVHVALLRGVNVGGKNKLPMAVLADICASVGCEDVRTYIQSGNVVFRSRVGEQVIARRIAGRIAKLCRIEAPVVVRSRTELRRIARSNPFLERGLDAGTLHVAFLARAPGKKRAATLDPKRSPGDSFRLVGRALYLHLPNGVARTKLTNAYLDATLGTTSTVRNWRTVTKLVEMADAVG